MPRNKADVLRLNLVVMELVPRSGGVDFYENDNFMGKFRQLYLTGPSALLRTRLEVFLQ